MLPKQSLRIGSQEVKISMIELHQLLRPEMPPSTKLGTSKMSLMQESGTMELKTLLMPKKISKMKSWTLKLDLKILSSMMELLMIGKLFKIKSNKMSTPLKTCQEELPEFKEETMST